MIDLMLNNYVSNCQRLSRALTAVMWNQWKCFVTQSQFGANVWDAMLTSSTPVSISSEEKEASAESRRADTQDTLEVRTRERLSKGLAPPREIYDIQNRERIDWSKIPDWARAIDPEIFAGCSHEG